MKIDIKRFGINGEGVGVIETAGELDKKVCFVSGALPDETVEVTIVDDKKNFAVCRLDKILTKSKNRIEPKCPYFSKCGGCDLQHISNEAQLDFKRNKVKETLYKISKIDEQVDDTIRVNDYAYRNKMVYPVVTRNGHAVVGMFENSSHRIVDIKQCLLCSNSINKIYKSIKEFIENSNFKGYDFRSKKGDIKYVVIREHSGQTLITIVSAKNIDIKPLYEYLHSIYNMVGLSLVISKNDNEIMSGKYIYIAGIESLEIEEFGIKYQVDNRGFLQVNNELKTALYNEVLSHINEEDVVVDGYSGAGLMSAIIAKKCRQVIGIEINESASNSAKQLAINNNLNNIKCITDNIKNSLGSVLQCLDKVVVILDPARSGCDSSVLECLTTKDNLKKISKIIYVSCNPSTLARDLGVLKDYYIIESTTPWDMFPQTKHVETLVCLKNKL